MYDVSTRANPGAGSWGTTNVPADRIWMHAPSPSINQAPYTQLVVLLLYKISGSVLRFLSGVDDGDQGPASVSSNTTLALLSRVTLVPIFLN